MRIALIGYGQMGKRIDALATAAGHEVVLRARSTPDPTAVEHSDVAIEFSTPTAASDNLKACFDAGVPVVCGTTGWLDRWDEIEHHRAERNAGFFYASNFSIGVHHFFELSKTLALRMKSDDAYRISIEEEHHLRKRDAPSGTAVTLANIALAVYTQLDGWICPPTTSDNALPISAERNGEVFGTHRLIFTSPEDTLTFEHRAHGREGFALGAIRAAAFMLGRSGSFGMHDLLNHDT